jgi:imidazolonepropionase-like amidohydrolase
MAEVTLAAANVRIAHYDKTANLRRFLDLIDEAGAAVAPGALADLLAIDGNPLDDIRVLTAPQQTLKLVMKPGTVYKNEL